MSEPTQDGVLALGLWLLALGGATGGAALAGLLGGAWWVVGLASLGGCATIGGAALYLPPILARLRQPTTPPRRDADLE